MTLAPAYEEIRRRALELVETRRIDPVGDRDAARDVVRGAVEEYQRKAHLGQGRALHNPSDMVDRVLRSVSELGPLTDLLRRTDVEEIFIEGGRVSYLDNLGRLRGLDQPTSEPENRHVVDRLLAETDRRLDASAPIVQARVLDGSARLTAVISPIADQLSATVRRYALRRETLASLVELGSLTVPAAGLLAMAMRTTASFLISGPPGSGKTSLLAAMIHAVPSSQCIRCCEEVRELHVPMVHGSYYEARPPSLDGRGEVSLRDLVKVILATYTFLHYSATSCQQAIRRRQAFTAGSPAISAGRGSASAGRKTCAGSWPPIRRGRSQRSTWTMTSRPTQAPHDPLTRKCSKTWKSGPSTR